MIQRDLQLIQGDDYASADGRALLFTGTGQAWPDLSGATLAMKIVGAGTDDLLASASGTRAVVSGVQQITVPLTASSVTSLLPQGVNSCEYSLQATISGRRITLATGFITVEGVAL